MIETVLDLPGELLSWLPQPVTKAGTNGGGLTGFIQGVMQRLGS
jgi:hypothetical protein